MKILEFSLVENLIAPTLGLHDASFGLQPITLLVDEKLTWNPTWQIWIMLAGIVGGLSRITIKVGQGGMCGGPRGRAHYYLLK